MLLIKKYPFITLGKTLRHTIKNQKTQHSSSNLAPFVSNIQNHIKCVIKT